MKKEYIPPAIEEIKVETGYLCNISTVVIDDKSPGGGTTAGCMDRDPEVCEDVDFSKPGVWDWDNYRDAYSQKNTWNI